MFFVLIAGIQETVARHYGYRPAISDSKEIWGYYRDRVYTRGGRKRLVIVGSSRAQLGLNPKVLQKVLPEFEVIHLALNGSPAREVVNHLCEDPDFDGILLWSAAVYSLPADKEPYQRGDSRIIKYYQETYLDQRKSFAFHKKIAEAWLQSRLILFTPGFSLREILEGLPPPNYLHLRFDRFRPAEYKKLMSDSRRAEHRAIRIQRRSVKSHGIGTKHFEQIVSEELPQLQRKLTDRGGKMIMLRMPKDGEYWEMDERDAPKARFWDQIEQSSGIPTIHFKDYEELADFPCPDGSHLDATDTTAFTQQLGNILRQKLFDPQ